MELDTQENLSFVHVRPQVGMLRLLQHDSVQAKKVIIWTWFTLAQLCCCGRIFSIFPDLGCMALLVGKPIIV